jgi:hypothetical protein
VLGLNAGFWPAKIAIAEIKGLSWLSISEPSLSSISESLLLLLLNQFEIVT